MVGGKIKKMCSRAVSGACSSRSRSDDADGAGPPSLIVRAERKKNTHTKKKRRKNESKKDLEKRLFETHTTRRPAAENDQRHQSLHRDKHIRRDVQCGAHRI